MRSPFTSQRGARTAGNRILTKPARPAPPAVGRAAARIVSDLARKTRFVDPALAADWAGVIGRELAALCRPGRLSGGRGGRTLEIYAKNGAAAARVRFEAETIRRKVNDYLGPGAVGRIVVRQAGNDRNTQTDRLDSALGRFRAGIAARRNED